MSWSMQNLKHCFIMCSQAQRPFLKIEKGCELGRFHSRHGVHSISPAKIIFFFRNGNIGFTFLNYQFICLAVVGMAMSIYYQTGVLNFEAIGFYCLSQVVKAVLSEFVSYVSRVNYDVWPFTSQQVGEQAGVAIVASSLPDITVAVFSELYWRVIVERFLKHSFESKKIIS